MKNVAVLLCLGVFLTVSCEKSENVNAELDGNYYGFFTVEYFMDMREGWSSSGTITLELKKGKYIYNSDVPPMSCSGNYSISNGKIIFEYDPGPFHPDLYLAPPYYDVNLILNREYDYTLDGKRLKFSKSEIHEGYYEYQLEKK